MKKLLTLLTLSSLSLVACVKNYNTGPLWTDAFKPLFDSITLEKSWTGPDSYAPNNRDQENGEVAFVSLTGGPEFETKTDYYTQIFESQLFAGVQDKTQYHTYSMNYAIQSQVHAYNAKWFGNIENTSLELANKLNAQSLLATNRLVKDLKSKNKKVILLGHSYGSFLANRYLATYGTDDLDMLISSAGRLNFNNSLASQLSNGGYGVYFTGSTVRQIQGNNVQMSCEMPRIIGVSSCTFWNDYRNLPDWVWAEGVSEKQKWDALNRDGIFLRLQGDLVSENYMRSIEESTATIEPSKVHFMYSDTDYTVGIMSQEEKQFIANKNYTSCNKDGGGHNNTACFIDIAKTIQTNILKK